MMTETVVRRSDGAAIRDAGGEDVYDDGKLRVEHDNYYVSVGGRALKLPRKEFLILSRLARNPERIVAAEELWRHAWGGRTTFNAESMHVHIYRLRRKLEPHGLRIETMVNVGYCLTVSREAGDDASAG